MSTTDDGAAEVASKDADLGLVSTSLLQKRPKIEPAGDPVRDGGAWRTMESAPKNLDPVLIVPEVSCSIIGFKPSRAVYVGWRFRDREYTVFDNGRDMSARVLAAYWMPLPPPPAARVTAAPQPDPDLETAITTLLAQVGSSHEAYPGAKRDLVRVFLVRHGAEARGEDVRACTCHPSDNPPVPCARRYALSECREEAARRDAEGDNFAFVEQMACRECDDDMERLLYLARAGAAALKPKPDAGDDAAFVERMEVYLDGRSYTAPVDMLLYKRLCALARRGARAPVAGGEPVAPVAWQWRSTLGPTGWGPHCQLAYEKPERHPQYEERPLYAHPPAPPAITAEHDEPVAKCYWCGSRGSWLTGTCDDCRAVGPVLRCDHNGGTRPCPKCRAYPIAEPPLGHQASPAAPVGGVSEAERAAVQKIAGNTYGYQPPASFASMGYVAVPEDDWSVVLRVASQAAARPTPDDGCPKGDPDCPGGNGDCHDECSTFAERGAADSTDAMEVK